MLPNSSLAVAYSNLLGPSAGSSRSHKTSPSSGRTSACAGVFPVASPCSEAANAVWADTASIVDQRRKKQYSVLLWSAAGTPRAFAFAKNVSSVQASSDQRPPTFMAHTTSLQRLVFSSSGYFFSFLVRAASSRTPSLAAARGYAEPSLRTGLAKVASSPSCAPL